MHLALKNGNIVEVPQKHPVKSLFCRHRNRATGERCSEHGLRRISGTDQYTVCMDCGKILAEFHRDYD